MRLNIGMIGYGTVGSGFIRVLRHANTQKMLRKNGITLNILAAAVRDVSKERPFPVPLTSNPSDLVDNAKVDVIVETTGAVEEIKHCAISALENGKHFVTANKKLVALHYQELMRAAEKANAQFLFEASVGGAVPIIRTLREWPLPIYSIEAVLNGTVNFMLGRMKQLGMHEPAGSKRNIFAESLAEAQSRGLAEADPLLDISGLDAAYKLAILATTASHQYVHPDKIRFRGLPTPDEIPWTPYLFLETKLNPDGEIKQLARFTVNRNDGTLNLKVQFVKVPTNTFWGKITGAQNGFVINDATYLYGEGAGALPTGFAILQDILEIATKKPVQRC
ncbi:MAG: homoserine dehydrogenase [Patescibacteria group bacterium]